MRRLLSVGLTGRMILLTVIAVSPALIIQAYNLFDLHRSRENDIRERAIQVTRQFGAEMGELREGARQLLVALARTPWVMAAEQPRCDQFLADLKKSYPSYESLSVADPTGQTVCSSSVASRPNVAELPFFQRAMARRGLAVGNYRQDPVSGAKTIHFAMRLDGPDDKPVGVVSAALDLKWLDAHLAERGLPSSASILIADRAGYIIARLPNGDTLIGKNMRKTHEKIMDGNVAGWEEAAGVDGLVRIFGYVPPALPPGDIFLSAGLSKAEAFQDIDRATERGVALILFGLMIAIAAAVYGGRYFIQKPVSALSRVIAHWRDGQYDIRAQSDDPASEVGQLTAAFNEMAEAVESRQEARRKAERGLAELAATLEERVEQRTAELAFAVRVKSQFLANMSHEIRTPMNGVLGMLELMLDDELSETQRRLAETALRSGQSLLTIVNGVLDLSKIEAGKLELYAETFNLRAMIREAVELFSGSVKAKNLNLSCEIAPNTPGQVVGDEGRIRQVLTNVLGNAVKFTKAGEIALRVGAADGEEGKIALTFEVQDTGIGIPTEKQREIFDVFAQADGSTTRGYGGTGLGLNIARQLCELMGGTINVESSPGKGTIFRFVVMVGRGSGETAMEPTEDWSSLRGRSILVCDDNAKRLETLEDMLVRAGARTHPAMDADAALRVLENAADAGLSFDFVLIARALPPIGAGDLVRRIRVNGASPNARIIILGVRDDVPDADLAGSDGWLAEPVGRAALYQALASAAARPRSIRHGSAIAKVPPPYSGKRVLLVEDNEVNSRVARIMLVREGCSVTTAANGHEAVDAYENGEFDLIFMDWQMPEMDGLDATAAIRAREAGTGRYTPIVAMTANAIEGDREVCLRAGMDDYQTKPISWGAIQTMLARWSGGPDRRPIKPAVEAAGTSERKPAAELSTHALGVLHELEIAEGPGFVRDVLVLFRDAATGLLEALRKGQANRDADAMKTASHSLKSSSAIIGAQSLSACCARLEALARQGLVDEAMVLVDEVYQEFLDVKPFIEAQILEMRVPAA